ncbi:MAG TPA: M67 family metallopeptidase [Candidatus Dormibacteraeota bacterium]
MEAGVVLSPSAAAELRRLAASAYPSEGCGVLVGAPGGGGALAVRSVTSGANLAARGRDRFELDPLAILRAERAARAAGLDVLGFWHSHPDHPAVPSRLDTERAWAEYLYVIVSSSADGTGDVRAWRLLPGAGGFAEVDMAVDGVATEAAR